jgi:hypothetical protein
MILLMIYDNPATTYPVDATLLAFGDTPTLKVCFCNVDALCGFALRQSVDVCTLNHDVSALPCSLACSGPVLLWMSPLQCSVPFLLGLPHPDILRNLCDVHFQNLPAKGLFRQ